MPKDLKRRETAELAKLSLIRRELVQARTVREFKNVRDKAELCRRWAARQGASFEVVYEAAWIKLDAERGAGAALQALSKNNRLVTHRHPKEVYQDGTLLKLSDLGIKTRNESSRWQGSAEVPIRVYREYLAECKTARKEPTSSGIGQIAKALKIQEVGEAKLPKLKGQYRTIYADPPWAYDDKTTQGSSAKHYPTMTVEQIIDLPIEKIAAKGGCHLWLWITWPKIRDGYAHEILQAWKFDWKGEIVWDKEVMGMGRWIRGRTEVLILATRGKLSRRRADVQGLFREKRSRKHSQKPEAFQILVESFSHGPRIELFARDKRKGWDRWGFEAK